MELETVHDHARPRLGRGQSDSPCLHQTNLSDQLAHILACSEPEHLGHRVQAAFLGTPNYQRKSMLSTTPLLSALHWQCLPEFLKRSGWREHGRLAFDPRSHLVAPSHTHVITLADELHLEIPTLSYVFVEKPARRAVIRVCVEQTRDFTLSLHATHDMQEFWQAWQRHARRENPLKGRTIRHTGKFVAFSRDYGWDDIYLDDRTIEEIKSQVEFFLSQDRHQMERLGIRQRRGLLLTGRPGTGKTLIGRILANSVPATFLWVTPGDILTISGMHDLLDLSRLLAPTVLFLEDIDVLAEDRESSGQGSLLGELMNQLDGVSGDHAVLTIATTNRLEVVELALRNRPGRFDRVVTVKEPPQASVSRMIGRRLTGHRIQPADQQWLVEKVTGRTGAELDELLNTLFMNALQVQKNDGGPLHIKRENIERALVSVPAHGNSSVGLLDSR